MNIRAICEGQFTLPLPVASAVPLFTPEGERRWAGSSWNPMYAIPDGAGDGSSPGTVFTTESDDGQATWIVLERGDDAVSYAAITRHVPRSVVRTRSRPTSTPGGAA